MQVQGRRKKKKKKKTGSVGLARKQRPIKFNELYRSLAETTGGNTGIF